METGFWEGIGYLLLLPVILLVTAIVYGPIPFSSIKARWGYRGVSLSVIILVTAILIWVFVFERM